DLVFLDRFDDVGREGVLVFLDRLRSCLLVFPLDGDLRSFEDGYRGLRDFRADTVARDEGYCVHRGGNVRKKRERNNAEGVKKMRERGLKAAATKLRDAA